jgi:hypothetical protein
MCWLAPPQLATFVFQRQMSDRTAAIAFAERMRQDRLAVYSAFAEASIQYRQSELDRWHRFNEDPDGEPYRTARAESYRGPAMIVKFPIRPIQSAWASETDL